MRLRRVIWNPRQSNGKLRNMKNQSFEVLCHKQIRNARRGSKEKSAMKQFFMTVVSVTFGALPEVHFLHDIYHFKAQEVKNQTLQTVYDLQLKWGRYGIRKTTASSWGTISHLAKLELQRAKFKVDGSCAFAVKSNMRKWFCNFLTWISTCKNGFQVAKSTCEIFASHHATCETGIFVHRLF